MLVGSLGLPLWARKAYEAKGLKSLYHWQADCLAIAGVLSPTETGHFVNLIYSAPTSGGKTLVSEMVMIKRLFDPGPLKTRIALFVLPYVSVVTEKDRYLSNMFKRSDGAGRVVGFYGGSTMPLSILIEEGRTTLAVCTIEKANAILNYLMESGSMESLVCTVLDEVHLLGDDHRGFLLELIVAKIRMFAPTCQLIAMSATVPNLDKLAMWLGGQQYTTGFRPVPLTEMVVADCALHEVHSGELLRHVEPFPLMEDRDAFLSLAIEVACEGHSVLVFCPSKQKCEVCAESIAYAFDVSKDSFQVKNSVIDERNRLIAELRICPSGLDSTLAKTIPMGVAYHHSGLTVEERSLIEAGYRSGALCCLTATSTLAAGVNLPARRVIFRSPYIAASFIDAPRYRQMAGRAGRAGQGEVGESIVICNSKKQAAEVVAIARTASLPALTSGLDVSGIQRLLLEVMSAVGQLHSDQIVLLAGFTLYFQSGVGDNQTLHAAMRYLLEKQMVALDTASQTYIATPLGRAVCSSGMDCNTGVRLFTEIAKVRSEGINLESDLHLCFLLVHASASESLSINWASYLRAVEGFAAAERRVVSLIGVKIGIIQKASLQGSLGSSVRATHDAHVVIRFFSALLLWLMVNVEVPIASLAARFNLPRGSLQQLRTNAGAFAGAVATFCSKMRWDSLGAIVDCFSRRTMLGVGQAAELAPLMQISGMTRSFAQELYAQGVSSPALVAKLSPAEVSSMVKRALPQAVAILPSQTAERIIGEAKRTTKQIRLETLHQAKSRTVQKQTVSKPPSDAAPQTPIKGDRKRKALEMDDFKENETPPDKREALRGARECLAEGLRKAGRPSVTTRDSDACVEINPRSLSQQSRGSRVSIGSVTTEPSCIADSALLIDGCVNVPFVRQLDSGELWCILDAVPSHVTCCSIEILPSHQGTFALVCEPFNCCIIDLITFKSLTSRPGLMICSSNVKELCITLIREYPDHLPQCTLFDTEIASHILEPDGIKPLHTYITPESEITSRSVPELYRSAFQTYELTATLLSDLEANHLIATFFQIEMPVLWVLAEMEFEGILVRPWTDSQHHVIAKMHAIEMEMNRIVGREVQLTSADDVSKALFEDLLLPIPACAAGKRGPLSNKEVLRHIEDPVADHIAEHRKLALVLSHSISITHAINGDTGRVHCKLAQMGTSTGRLVSTEPNLLCTENSFLVTDVSRTSLQDLLELDNCDVSKLVGQKVFVANSVFAPPRPRRIAEGELVSIKDGSSAMEGFDPSSNESLADYWIRHGWKVYSDEDYSCIVRQCEVRLMSRATSILTYPADQVWLANQPYLLSTQGHKPKLKICLRDMFYSPEGRLLLAVDYSQLEVRLLAHFSGDAALCKILRSPNTDVFVKIASLWLGKAEVSAEERCGCKKIVYGLLYGMGPAKMAEELGLTEEQAEKLVDKFFSTFPSVKPWIETTVAQTKACGYVESIGGRKRYLHGFCGDGKSQRKAERQAINSLCQASAADIVKVAMVRISRRFRDIPQARARILLQLHDELLIEFDSGFADDVRELVVQEMTRNVLSVCLEVKWAVGTSWGEISDAT